MDQTTILDTQTLLLLLGAAASGSLVYQVIKRKFAGFLEHVVGAGVASIGSLLAFSQFTDISVTTQTVPLSTLMGYAVHGTLGQTGPFQALKAGLLDYLLASVGKSVSEMPSKPPAG